jgi:hypothetical protein
MEEIDIQKTKQEFYDRINNARKLAIEHITKDVESKILSSIERGFDSSIIYKYQWASEKDATQDPSGNQIIFGDGIRLSDLIKKGAKYFFRDLNKFFNKDREIKYFTGVFPDRNGQDTVWNIYVSWNPEKLQKKLDKK